MRPTLRSPAPSGELGLVVGFVAMLASISFRFS
jgi:hypothetical protein